MALCSDGSVYTGASNNVDARVARHNAGIGAKYTRSRRPVKVIWRSDVLEIGDALRREHEIKRLSQIEKLKIARENIF
jgi:putative endonuclease